jgi:hypothetical protein
MTPFSNWPLIAGLVFCAMGVAFVHLSWQKLQRWPRAQGRVIALVRVSVLRCPEIEYRDAAGAAHRFVSRLPYHQRLRIGQEVEVAVNPDDPAEAERVNFISAVVSPVLMVLFGVIVVSYSLGLTR